MEINHTRISGVAHCGPLSEQPTTSKPNAFYGLIPDEIYNQASESTNLFNGNPLFKHHEYQVESQSNGQEKLLTIHDSLLSVNAPEETIAKQNNTTIIEPINIAPIKSQGIQSENFDNVNTSQVINPNNASLNTVQNEANNLVEFSNLNFTGTKAPPSDINERNELSNQNVEDGSLPKNLYDAKDAEKELPLENVLEPNKLNEPHIIVQADAVAQQAQLNQLATQIEELRLKVQELTVQNKMLSNTMNQDISNTSVVENNKTNEVKNITEEIIIHALPSEKSLDKAEDVVKS